MCRFVGHKNSQYKVDSCLNNEDSHVVSGSEDGQVYFWDLVEVRSIIIRNGFLGGNFFHTTRMLLFFYIILFT